MVPSWIANRIDDPHPQRSAVRYRCHKRTLTREKHGFFRFHFSWFENLQEQVSLGERSRSSLSTNGPPANALVSITFWMALVNSLGKLRDVHSGQGMEQSATFPLRRMRPKNVLTSKPSCVLKQGCRAISCTACPFSRTPGFCGMSRSVSDWHGT
jgi:hypothetical protein